MPTLQQRLEGGLYGLLIGDALGVPYEFHRPEALPLPAEIEMTPPAGFARTYLGVPPGTWSDDGAQALALLASLLDRGKLDLPDLGARLLAWADTGYMAVGNKVFDIGTQTSRSLGRLRDGIPAEQSGSSDEIANGNGSLMRRAAAGALAPWLGCGAGGGCPAPVACHPRSCALAGLLRPTACGRAARSKDRSAPGRMR